jgi:dipeptidyl aminopeptidase/acylaminoacyl peptidase
VRKLGVIGGAFSWAPDSRAIALATSNDRAKHVDKNDLWLVPVDRGASVDAPAKLTADYDEDAETPAWDPDSRTLRFFGAHGVHTRWVAVARRGGTTAGADFAGSASSPRIASNGRTAWIRSSTNEPDEIWIADRPGEAGRPLTSMNSAVSKLALGETSSVKWKSRDGTLIEGVLLRPRGTPRGAKLKTLLLLHGGPYGTRFDFGFQAMPQFIASHGYQILMPNFRSSGGYGTAFMLRKRADWGGADYQDCMSGVDSLIAWKLADPARLGVYGGSYGGHLTIWTITQTDRFKAAALRAGAVDYASFAGQTDARRYRRFEFEGWPWENPEGYRRLSPLTYIANAKTPTLILVGEQDARVPMPQSKQLYSALTALGVPAEFVHYPREPHGLREYRHRWDFAMRHLNWFDRWIR